MTTTGTITIKVLSMEIKRSSTRATGTKRDNPSLVLVKSSLKTDLFTRARLLAKLLTVKAE
jgi:hypothetical protein